jgi:hypothetical protein
MAWFDLALVLDPAAWLIERLGPLAWQRQYRDAASEAGAETAATETDLKAADVAVVEPAEWARAFEPRPAAYGDASPPDLELPEEVPADCPTHPPVEWALSQPAGSRWHAGRLRCETIEVKPIVVEPAPIAVTVPAVMVEVEPVADVEAVGGAMVDAEAAIAAPRHTCPFWCDKECRCLSGFCFRLAAHGRGYHAGGGAGDDAAVRANAA